LRIYVELVRDWKWWKELSEIRRIFGQLGSGDSGRKQKNPHKFTIASVEVN
jgi:hypothetical protein